MREGKPSFTASAVAAARAVAGVDEMAESLVGGIAGFVARAAAGGRTARSRIVNVATLGLVDHMGLRTLAIDAAVRDAAAAGARQIVVLGAGLDARAWRMRAALAEATVFEVDHPATQAYKRARVAGRAPAAREVKFVSVDFARDSLGDALARAGHDAGAATLWLWEGVVPYLPLDAVRTSLDAITARSAPGSRIAVTYGTPHASKFGPAFARAAQVAFRVIGEPLVGLRTREEMRAELERAGFHVLDDSAPDEWNARYGGGQRRFLVVEERLAVGERAQSSPFAAPEARS